MAQATLQIKIWTEGRGRTLPRSEQDIAELMVPHLEHVAGLCSQNFHSGQIVDDKFSGWWTVDRADQRKPTEKELIEALGTLLSEYGDIDAMLDSFAACGPEGMSSEESRRQTESNKARDKISKLYQRAIA